MKAPPSFRLGKTLREFISGTGGSFGNGLGAMAYFSCLLPLIKS
jgi:hypothetical protein